MKQAEITQLNRARPDLISNCYTEKQQILDYANKLATDAKTDEEKAIARNVKAFHDRVVEQFEAKADEGKEKKKSNRSLKDEYDIDY